MFSRVTNDSIRHGDRKVGSFLADGYSKTLRLGSVLDQAVRDGKAIYAVVEPLLRQFADTGRANRALTQGFKSVRRPSRQGDGYQPACAGHGTAVDKSRLLKMSIRRIYIDSRFRDYPEQDSHTLFYYTLKRSVSCPAGARLYVDYVQIPNTVKTIQAGVNDKLFWTSRALGGGPPTFNYQVLPEGNYDGVSLAAAVSNQMGSEYTVPYDESNLALNVSSATLESRFVLPSENNMRCPL